MWTIQDPCSNIWLQKDWVVFFCCKEPSAWLLDQRENGWSFDMGCLMVLYNTTDTKTCTLLSIYSVWPADMCSSAMFLIPASVQQKTSSCAIDTSHTCIYEMNQSYNHAWSRLLYLVCLWGVPSYLLVAMCTYIASTYEYHIEYSLLVYFHKGSWKTHPWEKEGNSTKHKATEKKSIQESFFLTSRKQPSTSTQLGERRPATSCIYMHVMLTVQTLGPDKLMLRIIWYT